MSPETVPDEFCEQVHDALAHLLDTAHLQCHPLLPMLVSSEITDPRARAQCLRETMLQAIADLKPPPGISPRDPAYRPYGILRHKYAEGFSNEDIQRQLAISRRQFFREQHRACEAVALLLWERRLTGYGLSVNETLAEELQQLGYQSQAFSLEDCTRQAIAAVKSFASAHGVALSLSARSAPHAFSDEAIARQLLISILSALVHQCPGGYLEIELSSEGRWAIVSFRGLRPELDADRLDGQLATPRSLADAAGARLEVERWQAGPLVRLRLPSSEGQVVAIVDDNPKTLRLFQRYLEMGRYRPLPIQESAEALTQICNIHPDAVVLDVMMRAVDGWQILQRLKADPTTRHIPVIVCSVLNEDDLARTIGADAYLRKPVSQSDLLLALAQVQRR